MLPAEMVERSLAVVGTPSIISYEFHSQQEGTVAQRHIELELAVIASNCSDKRFFPFIHRYRRIGHRCLILINDLTCYGTFYLLLRICGSNKGNCRQKKYYHHLLDVIIHNFFPDSFSILHQFQQAANQEMASKPVQQARRF